VPSPANTVLDIVVLVHDHADWADLCIRSVESFTSNAYRLIIVDSGSKEEKTKTWLKDMEGRGHTVLRLLENRSFSAGVNAGVALGSAPFIVILNDDAIVTEGWDAALTQDANSKHVGLVGAKSNYVAGAQGDPTFIGAPPYLVFVCVALRRDVWNVVGPMDEVTFDGFSTEDIDYSWRVKKAGFELKVSSAYVLHAGSRTLATEVGAWRKGADGVASTTELRQKNDAKYNARLLEKWGQEWIAEHTKMIGNVLVVTYHAEDWTRVDFMGALMGLRRSDGVGFSYYHSKRSPIQFARNAVADYALDRGFDWLIQLDDDAIFPSDLLRRLLVHQKDVVCALAYQRRPPHLACVYEIGEDGLLGKAFEGIEHTGLRKVDVSGFHCSIMRTSVIERLRDGLKGEKEGDPPRIPGTRLYYGGFDNKVGEDFAFSLNCKKVGIQIYVDTDLIAGHIGDSIVVDEAYRKRYVQGG
jgi:glycosyltransferase involved in cell wall biosynthesis